MIEKIKNIIAIASGKGGVGKSTTAVNLAFAFLQTGARVGLLDADIYGPNQPLMLGVDVQQLAPIHEGKNFKPVLVHGLQTISIGYLVDPNTPTIWRGPMISGALQQLANQTLWENLDYLIIDMPPGTGDIPLTLMQKIPLTGAILVTTPQEVAVADARKGLEMFKKMKIPVLGVIENMSLHTCSHCGHAEAIFGENGGEILAKTCDVPFLGKLPLHQKIREDISRGVPTVLAHPENPLSKIYKEIALHVVAELSLLPVNYRHKFPKITVE